ncbi:MAG: hypothetical protein KF894_23675 [Labilithrix sp.]|nr:hypothetical protein [Labilithrix sp.]
MRKGGTWRRARPDARRSVPAAAGALVLVASFSAGDARADFDFQVATMVSGAWLRETPDFNAKGVTTSARDIGAGRVRTRGGLAMAGVGGDVELTIDDRWRVPLFGGMFFWAVGSYDATITSFDGSIARLRPWTTMRGDFLTPGVGRRWKHRRNMLGVAVRTGLSVTTIGGHVAAGGETAPLEMSAVTFLLQLELEGCRRLDPTTRACLQVVPRLYDNQLLNGLTVGLRMEWGR